MRFSIFLALALTWGCGVDEVGIEPPTDELYFPVGMDVHPDGRYLYVANGVFDRKFNKGTVMVYDTYERQLLADATVPIGLFGGEIAVRRLEGEQVVAYTTSRDDNELLRLEVEGQGAELLLPAGGELTEDVSADPFGMALDPQGLMLTHLSRGIVSFWYERAEGLTFGCDHTLPAGATNVARHPSLGWAYVTDRTGQRVQLVEPVHFEADGEGLTRDACEWRARGHITVDGAESRGRTRGLSFSADGTLLYVASSTDSSVRIYDSSVRSDGRPRNTLLWATPAGSAPNVIKVAGLRPGEVRPPDGLDGPARDALDLKGEGLVYATVFNDDRVVVIDPDNGLVIARIDTGKGPHDIVFLTDPSGGLRGYVSNFRDNSLSVIDLEPGSPSRFTVVATVQ